MRNALIFALIFTISPLAAQTPKKGSSKPRPKAAAVQEQTPLQKALTDLKSKDPSQRRLGAEELGRLRDPRANPALVVALSDEDAAVRANSARALGLMRSPDGLKELGRLLETDASPEVRQSAAVALGFIGDHSGAEVLSKALKDSHPGTRYAASQALANLKSPKAVPALVESLKEPEPQFRRAAIQSLGEIGDPSAIPALKPFLTDKDAAIQLAAVHSLGKLKDTSSASAFKKMLKKKDDANLRVAAAQALARQNNPAGRKVALDILKDKTLDVPVRLQAVQALREMPDRSLRGPVEDIKAQEPEGPVKQSIDSLLSLLPQ